MRRDGFSLNIFWALLLLVGAGVWFFQTQGGIPAGVLDLARRVAPAVLIAFGLLLLIGRRVPFGNFLAIVLAGAAALGMATVAYSRQASVVRTDYAVPVLFQVPGTVDSLTVDLQFGLTEIEIKPAATGDRAIRGEYLGTLESEVLPDFQTTGARATLVIRETPRSNLPSLELIGRGKLTLTLPANLPIDQLTIITREGNLTIDGSTLVIRSLKAEQNSGDSTVQLGTTSGLIGDLRTGAGSITVRVPTTIAAQVTLRGGGASNAQFNQSLYTLSIERVLVPKVNAPNAQIIVDAPGQITIAESVP